MNRVSVPPHFTMIFTVIKKKKKLKLLWQKNVRVADYGRLTLFKYSYSKFKCHPARNKKRKKEK